MGMLAAAQDLVWQDVPQQAVALAEKCAGTVQQARQAIKDLPQDGFLSLYYRDDQDKLWLNVGDWMSQEDQDQWERALSPLAARLEIADEAAGPGDEAFVKIAFRPLAARVFLEKRAVSPSMSALSQGLGWRPGVIPGAPNRLMTTLTTGLLGAGLGYGAGWLGEKFMPNKWKRGNMRRTLAILGGLGGAGLGFGVGGLNWGGPTDTVESHIPYQYNPATKGYDFNPGYTGQRSVHALPELEPFYGKQVESMAEAWEKQAFESMTGFQGGQMPPIIMPDFHAAVNLDPRVRNRLSPAERAAATGLVMGASAMSGGARLVSPMDVGRMAAGMGSGYLSGMIVGKVLGALTGMPPNTQEKLKNTGMWAGAIRNVVPLAFGL